MTDRYNTSHLIEDQYEPGSDGKVLQNLLGITSPEEMEIAETADLWLVQEILIGEVSSDCEPAPLSAWRHPSSRDWFRAMIFS